MASIGGFVVLIVIEARISVSCEKRERIKKIVKRLGVDCRPVVPGGTGSAMACHGAPRFWQIRS